MNKKYAPTNYLKGMTIECIQCKQSYTVRKKGQTFCSPRCRWRFWKNENLRINNLPIVIMDEKIICIKCGKESKRIKSTRKFCSNHCRWLAWAEKHPRI